MDYQYYNQLFKHQLLPLAYLDLDLFDKNILEIKKRCSKGTIRIASKSLRCRFALERILNSGIPYQGIMTFSPWESVWLSENGFDNLLIGYPTVNRAALEAICIATANRKEIIPMVDCIQHLDIIQEIAKKNEVVQPVCIDVDMSSDFPGVHFGVYRSSITNLNTFKKFLDTAITYPNIRIVGIMGYEAQIAGIGTKTPTEKIKSNVIKVLKYISIKELAKRRADCVNYAITKGVQLDFVNGGGTGSMETTLSEDCVTEVTVGSGFYSPALFDDYEDFHHLPAVGFACEITRLPAKNIFTCSGGGYIASGGISVSKQPKPYLPKGIELFENEGAGEVQTPVKYSGKIPLNIGDTILFRHAKAGEICERFNALHIISEGKIKTTVETYRGENKCFL